MLMPVATVVCVVASGQRVHADKRKWALDILQKLTPACCIVVGLTAGMGLLVSMLHTWGTGNHDIARSVEDLAEFRSLMRTVFTEGWVVCSDTRQAGVTVNKLHGQLVTCIVRKAGTSQLMMRAGVPRGAGEGPCQAGPPHC